MTEKIDKIVEKTGLSQSSVMNLYIKGFRIAEPTPNGFQIIELTDKP